MDFLIGFILLFTVFILILLLSIHLKTRNQGRFLFDKLKHIKDFSLSQFIMGQQNSFLLAVDKERELVAYILPNSQIVFPYESVLRIEMLEDDVIVSERVSERVGHNSSFQEVVSKEPYSLSPLKKEDGKSKVAQVVMRITLSKGENPWLPIYCFNAKTQLFGGSRTLDLTNMESQMYRKGKEMAYHLDMMFSKIIDRVDEEYLKERVFSEEEKEIYSDAIPKLIADELEKLFELKIKGALSPEEFSQQKKKLLE